MHEIGGGRTESNIMISFLNLTRSSKMKSASFQKIEDKLGFLIKNISLKSMIEALREEIRIQLIEDGQEEDYVKWLADKKIDQVFLTILFNMEWSKRSSSTRCDSKSGHAFIIGALSKKNRMKVLSKECSKCKAARR